MEESVRCGGRNCYEAADGEFVFSRANHPEFCVSLDRTMPLCKSCQESEYQAEIWMESLVNYNGTSMDLPSCWIPLVEKFVPKPPLPLKVYRGLWTGPRINYEVKTQNFEKISYWSTSREVAEGFAHGGVILELELTDPDWILLDARNWKLSQRLEEQMIVLKPGISILPRISKS